MSSIAPLKPDALVVHYDPVLPLPGQVVQRVSEGFASPMGKEAGEVQRILVRGHVVRPCTL